MHICVLNLGLKSMRAAVFDEVGRRAAIAYRPIATQMGEGRVEQSAADWWTAADEVLREVLADPALAGEVGLMTVTASAGCLVALGDAVEPLGMAIMISDVRATHEAAQIAALESYQPMASQGRRVTPDLMLPKIAWLQKHDQERYAAARWLASPNDFLVAQLTGQIVTDAYNASKYFYDVATGRYPEELVGELGIDAAKLPPIAQPGMAPLEVRSEYRRRWGLSDGVRVVLSTYDAICAAYGSGAMEVGDGCDVSGTVTSFRVVTDRSDRDPSGRLFISPHVREGFYLAGGSNNLGGGVIEWAKQLLYADEVDPYDAMTADARDSPPGSAGITFLPYLLGERAPVWDADARAVFFGLGRNHGRADMTRSIFEGVSYSVLDIAQRLDEIGIPLARVFASGGLARIEPILQIKADMLGVTVQTNEELETTALGAAIMASVAGGCYNSIEDATGACVRFGASFEPDAARTAMYRDFFSIYRSLYGDLRAIFRQRNRLIERHAEVLRTDPSRTENL
jgi:xylulokinase